MLNSSEMCIFTCGTQCYVGIGITKVSGLLLRAMCDSYASHSWSEDLTGRTFFIRNFDINSSNFGRKGILTFSISA